MLNSFSPQYSLYSGDIEMTETVTTTKEAVASEDDKTGNSKHLLDKDWGARVPEYVSKGCVATAVFIMGITMRGDASYAKYNS